jgi:predicted metal-binding protein
MSKPATSLENPFRLYPSKWNGPVLLICRKCEKKLKKSGAPLKVKKSLKRLARQDPNPHLIQVVPIGCMDLCPKGSVTVCPSHQLTQARPGLIILRTQEDIATLYEQCLKSTAT